MDVMKYLLKVLPLSALGVGSLPVFKKMKESASSCEFETMKDMGMSSPMRHKMAKDVLNSRKGKKRPKKINPREVSESALFAGKIVNKANKAISGYVPSGELTPLILKKLRVEGKAIQHYGKKGKLAEFLRGKFS